jgi:hypothetical protein
MRVCVQLRRCSRVHGSKPWSLTTLGIRSRLRSRLRCGSLRSNWKALQLMRFLLDQPFDGQLAMRMWRMCGPAATTVLRRTPVTLMRGAAAAEELAVMSVKPLLGPPGVIPPVVIRRDLANGCRRVPLPRGKAPGAAVVECEPAGCAANPDGAAKDLTVSSRPWFHL